MAGGATLCTGQNSGAQQSEPQLTRSRRPAAFACVGVFRSCRRCSALCGPSQGRARCSDGLYPHTALPVLCSHVQRRCKRLCHEPRWRSVCAGELLVLLRTRAGLAQVVDTHRNGRLFAQGTQQRGPRALYRRAQVMVSHLRSALLALALVGSASADFTCAGSDNQTVCNALSAIYTATGGASWTTNTGWGGGSSYCTPWAGLTCSSGVVTAMNLASQNLVGTVPDVFTSMTALANLDLSNNALTGTLQPSAIALCSTSGVSCTFAGNSGLSTAAFACPSPAGGMITIPGVPQPVPGVPQPLACVKVYTGGFTAVGSGGRGDTTSWYPPFLAFDGNPSWGSFFDTYDTKNYNVDGTYNRLKSTSASTTTVDNVQYWGDWLQLSLKNATFVPTSYTIYFRGGSVDPMNWVVLGSNDGVAWYLLDQQNAPLGTTNIPNAPFTFIVSGSAGYAAFRLVALAVDNGQCMNVPEWSLYGTTTGPSALAILLNSAVNSKWGIAATLPSLNSLSGLPLTSLVISNQGNALTGAIPDIFTGMTQLTYLDLSNNALVGTLPQSAVALCAKQSVTCNFAGNTNLSVSNIISAWPLNVSSFSGYWGLPFASIPNLSSLTYLTSIALSGFGLTGTIPTWIGSLTALQSLDLSINAFTGTIPTGIGSLTALQSLDLSNNAFTGTIPDVFGSTLALTFLRLSSNSLVGSLPLSFGGLGSAVIKVDGNHGLNGPIPTNTIANCAAILVFHQLGGADFSTTIGQVCDFGSTSLALPLPGSSGSSGSSFDPTSLLATIAAMNATIAALQVNITAARAACSV